MEKFAFMADKFPPDDDCLIFTPRHKTDALEVTMHKIDFGIPDDEFFAVVSEKSLCGFVVHVKDFDPAHVRAILAALNKCEPGDIVIVARNPEPHTVA